MDNVKQTSSEEKSHLINLISEEIKKINDEEIRPGWTKWALIGGLAACLWLLLNQFEVHFSWESVRHVLIDLTFIGLLFQMISSNFKGILVKSNSGRIMSFKEIVSNSRLRIFVSLVWVGLMFCFVLMETHSTRTISLGVLGVLGTVMLLSLFLSNNTSMHFRTDPVSGKLEKTSYSRGSNAFIALLFVSIFLISFLRVFEMFEQEVFEMNELKIGLLIFSIFLILLFLSSFDTKSDLLENLNDLRRDLILDNVPIEQIREQVDLALKGQKIDSFFNNEVSQLLNVSQTFSKEIFVVSEKVKLYSEKASEKDEFAEETLKESINQDLTSIAERFLSSTELMLKKLRRKAKMLKMQQVSFDSAIFSELLESIDERSTRYNDLVKTWFQTLEKYENLDSAKSMINNLNTVPQLNFNPLDGSLSNSK